MPLDPSIILRAQSPDVIGNTLATLGQMRQEQRQDAVVGMQRERHQLDTDLTRKQILNAEQATERDAAVAKADHVARSLTAILSLPAGEQQAAYDQTKDELHAAGLDVSAFPARWSYGWGRSSAFKALSVKEQLAQLEAEQPAVPEPFTLSPGQQRFGPDGQPIATVPAPPPSPPAGFNLSPGQTRFGPDGTPVASLPATPPSTEHEPLVAVIDPQTGQPVLRRRSQSEGLQPASNREQGRPVTTGDTGRISDLRTSLNDLQVLRSTLGETAEATGTGAAIGAALPKWATDLTGWGTDAKKRQGVIDRVKQVIGKALEGGVLRKEDEIKYAKILPTIGDTQAVAASKLDGLELALAERLDTFLSDLRSSGFDTTAHEERTSPRASAPSPKKNPFRNK